MVEWLYLFRRGLFFVPFWDKGALSVNEGGTCHTANKGLLP